MDKSLKGIRYLSFVFFKTYFPLLLLFFFTPPHRLFLKYIYITKFLRLIRNLLATVINHTDTYIHHVSLIPPPPPSHPHPGPNPCFFPTNRHKIFNTIHWKAGERWSDKIPPPPPQKKKRQKVITDSILQNLRQNTVNIRATHQNCWKPHSLHLSWCWFHDAESHHQRNSQATRTSY